MTRTPPPVSRTMPQARRNGTARVMSATEAGLTTDDICAFYSANWARPIALSRADFAQWQFCAPPSAGGENHSIVALDGDQLIAVMGVTPSAFHCDSQVLEGAELTTWVVSHQARGKGVGAMILATLQMRYDVLAGAGITTAAIPLYLQARFTFLAHVPRFFFISDFDKISAFVAADERAVRLTATRQAAAHPFDGQATPVAAADLAPVAGSLSGMGHFARDAARLAWRYDDHPAFHYEAYRVAGAGVILRADCVAGTPFLHIIDLFADSTNLPAILAFIEAEAKKRGAAFVDISATSGPICGHLRARGWSSSVDDPILELPALFYPVELRHPATTSLAFWTRDNSARLHDLSRVHTMRGDMDLDRPTLAWYEGNAA